MGTWTEIKAALFANIITPLITLLFAAALFLFLWGLVKFIWKADNPTARKEGQGHMIWGAVGMGIMLSAFGLVHFVFNTVTDNGKAEGIDGNPVTLPPVLEDGFR
ncbi:hypothetical protein KW782_03035 [Candidatus Parcubacteria bacterium]|nr:hypothetical protein [Candidatus Parcubacteria bacterium]